ncbi:MAG: PIG-L family deacetylase [Comamonas sp.]|jgi:LmbE family N-acetylglucosaminyl deacetylase|nr:PIG-L family deacetylase [Comamonas sp.]
MTSSIAQWLQKFRGITVIAPHPDDEVLGAYGIIRRAQGLGLTVDVHVVTDGERCFGDLPQQEDLRLRQTRQQESCQVAALIGYPEPTFWSLSDSQVMQQERELDELLRRYCTADSLCIAPWFHDGHPDHEAVGLRVKQLAAQGHCTALFYPVWALVDPQRSSQFFNQGHVSRLALTEEELAQKKSAMRLFRSQSETPAHGGTAIVQTHHMAQMLTHQESYWYEA